MLSIIVPVYNCEINVFKRAVLSIIPMTIEKELIVIDDGSQTELSKQYINLLNDYDFAHYYHQDNLGVSAARNYGILLSKGKYLIFLDADDEFSPQFITFLNNQYNKINADLLLCDVCRINVLNKQVKKSTIFDSTNFVNKAELYDINLNDVIKARVTGRLNECWGKLILRELIVKFNISFPEGVTLGEDVVFNTRLLHVINSIQYVPIFGYIYYMYSNNVDRAINEGELRYKRLSERESELTKLIKERVPIEYQGKFLLLQKIRLINVVVMECCGFCRKKKFDKRYRRFIEQWINNEKLLADITISDISNARAKLNYIILKYKMWWVITIMAKLRGTRHN